MDGYAELRAFRATHQYRSLTVGGVEWKYLAGPATPDAPAEVNSAATGASTAAADARPALLILGGGFSFGDSAFRTISAFEPRFRVISPSYPPVRTMAELLAGVAAILDAEGIRSASVFGHSLGAGVAHAFSRLYPRRVDRLILSGFGLYTAGHTRLLGAFVRLFSILPEAALAGFYRRRMTRLVAGAEENDRAFLTAYTEDLFAAHTKDSALARLAALLDLATHQDQYAATSAFERPEDVLVIAASDDRGFTPHERETLLATYPGARTCVFAAGGHLTAVAHPAEYADVAGRFLDGRPPAGPGGSAAAPPHRPAPNSSRVDRSAGPPAALDARLAAFRATHPYRTLDVGGLRWRYLAGGAGEQTVLLPSGGTRLPDMYLLLIEALERDFRVIAPAYPAGAGIAGLTDGLAAILDAEGVGRADVLGSSFGGFVAQAFARRHPDRVRRLVLANTGGPTATPLPLLPYLIRFLAVLPENVVRSMTGWNWRRWFVPESQADAAFWKSLLSDVLSQLGKDDLLSGLREMNDFAQLPAGAPGVRTPAMPPAPVLLIESEKDEAFPPQARAALRAIYPAAEVRLFPGAGHGVMATRTAEYVATVREFLRRP